MGFPVFELAFFAFQKESSFQDGVNSAKIAEIRGNSAKVMRKVPFQNKEI